MVRMLVGWSLAWFLSGCASLVEDTADNKGDVEPTGETDTGSPNDPGEDTGAAPGPAPYASMAVELTQRHQLVGDNVEAFCEADPTPCDCTVTFRGEGAFRRALPWGQQFFGTWEHAEDDCGGYAQERRNHVLGVWVPSAPERAAYFSMRLEEGDGAVELDRFMVHRIGAQIEPSEAPAYDAQTWQVFEQAVPVERTTGVATYRHVAEVALPEPMGSQVTQTISSVYTITFTSAP